MIIIFGAAPASRAARRLPTLRRPSHLRARRPGVVVVRRKAIGTNSSGLVFVRNLDENVGGIAGIRRILTTFNERASTN